VNKRIKEIADECGLYIAYDNKAVTNKEIEFFAELIVRECAQVCRDQPNHYALKTDRDNCAVAIKQHFGVEE